MPLIKEDAPQVSLTALLSFESVARHMNFGRAALEMEVTPTAMSKMIKKLEAELGVRLFNRTTRSVGLTEHGRELLSTLTPALDLINKSMREIGESAARPKGLLRINTSYVAFASLIQPYQADFVAQYPDVTLEFVMDDRLADIVASGFDAGIRPGHNVQRDMIALPLGGPQKMVVVASPAYLDQHGTPKMPKDLLNHDCIRQRFVSSGRFFEWRFQARDKVFSIDVSGKLIYSEMRSVLDGARQGLGLAYVFRKFANQYIQAGQLVPVLDKCCEVSETFYLYYPNRAQTPGKLRAFIDFIQKTSKAGQ